MESCRRVIFFSFLLYLCFGLFGHNSLIRAEPPGGKNGKKIVFQWAFCTLRKADAYQKPKIVDRNTAMKSGDQIKFFLKSESPCYLYLIHLDPQQQLKVLYPSMFSPEVGQSTGSGEQYILDGHQWFELDEITGQEKFYLLASVQPLSDLENLVKQYESTDKRNHPGLVDLIIAEIRNLRKRHLKFKTYSEKPVSIIGKVHGSEQKASVPTSDIADCTVEISTTTFFSRTYTIKRQKE